MGYIGGADGEMGGKSLRVSRRYEEREEIILAFLNFEKGRKEKWRVEVGSIGFSVI